MTDLEILPETVVDRYAVVDMAAYGDGCGRIVARMLTAEQARKCVEKCNKRSDLPRGWIWAAGPN